MSATLIDPQPGTAVTDAQRLYEAEIAARPLYHDGTPRKPWDSLHPVAQWSWGRPVKD